MSEENSTERKTPELHPGTVYHVWVIDGKSYVTIAEPPITKPQ
jgi:hypothetical protein